MVLELLADRFTTIEAMRRVRAASNHCFLLESAEGDQRRDRYSFLGFNPSVEVACVNGTLTVTRDVEGEHPQVERRRVERFVREMAETVRAALGPRMLSAPRCSASCAGGYPLCHNGPVQTVR